MAAKFPRVIRAFCLFFISVSLGACSGLTESDKPAERSWWLTPYSGELQPASPDSVSSIVVSVSVVPGLDTDRILALSDQSELKPYSGARWVENLPELATSLVSRSLESTGRFKLVSERARADSRPCDLQLEIREFYANLDSSGTTSSVQISIIGRSQCESETALPIQLKASVPVHDERMSVIVAAFQRAVDEVMKDLLETLP